MQFNFAWFSCWCAKILSGSLCLWKVWIITKVKKEDSSLSKNRHQRHRCENEAESESLGLCTLLPSFPWPLESLQLCFAICFLLGAPYTKEVNERAKNGDVGRCCYSSWGDALVLMIQQYITYLKIATRKKRNFLFSRWGKTVEALSLKKIEFPAFSLLTLLWQVRDIHDDNRNVVEKLSTEKLSQVL